MTPETYEEYKEFKLNEIVGCDWDGLYRIFKIEKRFANKTYPFGSYGYYNSVISNHEDERAGEEIEPVFFVKQIYTKEGKEMAFQNTGAYKTAVYSKVKKAVPVIEKKIEEHQASIEKFKNLLNIIQNA